MRYAPDEIHNLLKNYRDTYGKKNCCHPNWESNWVQKTIITWQKYPINLSKYGCQNIISAMMRDKRYVS